MLNIFIIIIIAFLGLSVIGWIGVRYLLHKAFYHPPIQGRKEPGDFGLTATEYFLNTANGKKIQTYLIKGEESKPVIIGIHGWENTVDRLLPLAQFLSKMGYTILLLNTRNHGKSDQDSYSTMVKYSQDLAAALTYIETEYSKSKTIILMGHSLGAATSLYTAANDRRVDGVIAIASFSDLRGMIMQSFLKYHFPAWLISPVIKYIERGIGETFENLSPLSNVPRIKAPLLLLHGSEDIIVPVDNFEILKNLTTTHSTQASLIRGCDHSSLLDNEETFQVIKTFLNQYHTKINPSLY